jgi:hypothetical protein
LSVVTPWSLVSDQDVPPVSSSIAATNADVRGEALAALVASMASPALGSDQSRGLDDIGLS